MVEDERVFGSEEMRTLNYTLLICRDLLGAGLRCKDWCEGPKDQPD